MELRKQRGLAKVIARLLPGKEDRSPAPEGQVGARRSLSLFARALEELPPKQRAIMVMVHLEEKSQTDAATLLGLSKGQVSKLHQRALDTLRAQQWDVGHA
jgi:RNA polymerase sigma factor (sigma-70 family)